MSHKAFLRLEHVNFSYYSALGEIEVINDLSFSIEKGSFTAFVGPSGCGKSTILSLIAGLLQPTNGSLTFYSEKFTAPGIGYMLQHDHLLEWRDVYHNILLGLEIQHKLTKDNLLLVDELLEKYGVELEEISYQSGITRRSKILV